MLYLVAPFLFAIAQMNAGSPAAADNPPSVLFTHIWRVTSANSSPARGTIFVFLPDHTLLRTSCVETYRISRWSADPKNPNVLRIVEDGVSPYTLSVRRQSNRELRVLELLERSGEKRELTLTAVDKEYVCPDMPK